MEDYKPFAPPTAPVADVFDRGDSPFPLELAERSARLGASLLDGLILLVPFGLIYGIVLALYHQEFRFLVAVTHRWDFKMGMTLFGSLLYLAINGRFLAKDGQTLGKKACSIRIAKPDGTVPSLMDSYVKRNLLVTVIRLIPVLGSIFVLADALCIFRNKRKCLHDDLAGTIVIKSH